MLPRGKSEPDIKPCHVGKKKATNYLLLSVNEAAI
jgi:hypothetical protein